MRKNIWEINKCLFCSIITTCLSIREQKTILKKSKISFEGFSLYRIHQMMVQSLDSENRLSRRINNYLNQKHRREVVDFNDYDDKKFLLVWKEKMKTGDICGLYWAAVTRLDFSKETLQTIFGDVHMLSFLNGDEIRRELREANILREKNQKLRGEYKDERELRRKINKELHTYKKTCLEMERKCKIIEEGKIELVKELETLRSDRCINELEAVNLKLRAQLKQAQRKLQESLNTLKSLKRESEKLALSLSSQTEINHQLKSEVKSMLRQAVCNDLSDKNCQCCNIWGKRVLIVGGRSKLKQFYQDLIEKMGGTFEYHDGYVRSGADVLRSLVGRADIILCPVDCNSHNACLCVKKLCKKQNKTYRMLQSSGLSTMVQAVSSLAEEN